MNYELAKQLKDVGFPQCEEESEASCHAHGCWRAGSTYGYDNCHNPTLSELIDACGEVFYGLTALHDQNKWTAHGFQKELDATTPTEAVARLYIALHAV